MRNEGCIEGVFPQPDLSGVAEPSNAPSNEERERLLIASKDGEKSEAVRGSLDALGRIACFFGFLTVLVFGFNAMITSGLRQIKTSQYGASNRIMQGDINAQIVITGSSRAVSHYDPRVIQATTGRSAFNIGRNGSQTDMQIAVLKAYLEHNRKPEVIVHNLDAFSFVTTREVYDPGQYVPYLGDEEIYQPLRQINKNIWRSRYVPLYGYVVDDMRFNWMLGLRGFVGWSPREDFYLGFNPRSAKWTDEFEHFEASNPHGVSWEIEPAGVRLVEGLIRLCQANGIQLILVYSPEYAKMQRLTNNRPQLFGYFQDLAARYHVPLWDYSSWQYAGSTKYFTNSQHLNAEGAEVFSADLAARLKDYLAQQRTTVATAQNAR